MVSARIADASSASHDLSHCCSGTQRVAKPRRVVLFDSIYTAAVLLCDQQEELKRSAVIAYQCTIAVAEWLDILRAGSLSRVEEVRWTCLRSRNKPIIPTFRPGICLSQIVQRLVSDPHQRFRSSIDGHNSQAYPARAAI